MFLERICQTWSTRETNHSFRILIPSRSIFLIIYMRISVRSIDEVEDLFPAAFLSHDLFKLYEANTITTWKLICHESGSFQRRPFSGPLSSARWLMTWWTWDRLSLIPLSAKVKSAATMRRLIKVDLLSLFSRASSVASKECRCHENAGYC